MKKSAQKIIDNKSEEFISEFLQNFIIVDDVSELLDIIEQDFSVNRKIAKEIYDILNNYELIKNPSKKGKDAKYKHTRIESPKHFDKESFRTITLKNPGKMTPAKFKKLKDNVLNKLTEMTYEIRDEVGDEKEREIFESAKNSKNYNELEKNMKFHNAMEFLYKEPKKYYKVPSQLKGLAEYSKKFANGEKFVEAIWQHFNIDPKTGKMYTSGDRPEITKHLPFSKWDIGDFEIDYDKQMGKSGGWFSTMAEFWKFVNEKPEVKNNPVALNSKNEIMKRLKEFFISKAVKFDNVLCVYSTGKGKYLKVLTIFENKYYQSYDLRSWIKGYDQVGFSNYGGMKYEDVKKEFMMSIDDKFSKIYEKPEIKNNPVKAIIGCPEGHYNRTTGKCKTGTRIQAILKNPISKHTAEEKKIIHALRIYVAKHFNRHLDSIEGAELYTLMVHHHNDWKREGIKYSKKLENGVIKDYIDDLNRGIHGKGIDFKKNPSSENNYYDLKNTNYIYTYYDKDGKAYKFAITHIKGKKYQVFLYEKDILGYSLNTFDEAKEKINMFVDSWNLKQKITNAFDNWLDTFIEEKDIDLTDIFEVKDAEGTDHVMSYGVITEYIKKSDKDTQKKFKDKVVMIDFKNGDVLDFFRYIGKGIV